MPGQWGRKFEPCLGGVGNLNQKYQVFPGEHTFYLLIWRCLKKKSSLSQADGGGKEEEVYRV